MKLTSSAFSEGGVIPSRHSCDGQNASPPLSWSGPPAQTRSFTLLCEDPDAPGGLWHHWAVFDIPCDRRALAMNYGRDDLPGGPRQALNDFHRRGYDGPCPPHGHGPHHYCFRLLALSVDHLPLGENPSCSEVAERAKACLIAAAVLVGRYER